MIVFFTQVLHLILHLTLESRYQVELCAPELFKLTEIAFIRFMLEYERNEKPTAIEHITLELAHETHLAHVRHIHAQVVNIFLAFLYSDDVCYLLIDFSHLICYNYKSKYRKK